MSERKKKWTTDYSLLFLVNDKKNVYICNLFIIMIYIYEHDIFRLLQRKIQLYKLKTSIYM